LQRPPENQLDYFLHQAWKIASALRARRFNKGALELDFPEVRVRIDQSGKAIGLIKEENDISHQLIEEFMLLANEIVGRETKNRSLPSVYRVHEDPDPEKLLEFRELARMHGLTPGDLSQKREMQRFLKSIAGRPDEGLLKVSLLRSLRKAIYLPTPLGHFGLAKGDYTHFTSPIRRYADLIVHRTFNALLSDQSARKQLIRSSHLEEVCEHISTTERIAADAEREAVRLKKLSGKLNRSSASIPGHGPRSAQLRIGGGGSRRVNHRADSRFVIGRRFLYLRWSQAADVWTSNTVYAGAGRRARGRSHTRRPIQAAGRLHVYPQDAAGWRTRGIAGCPQRESAYTGPDSEAHQSPIVRLLTREMARELLAANN
jgi:hypothetical protein